MNKDTKILLMAIVIILVALVSFNLSDLTGRLIEGSDITTITVSPTLVTFGERDTIKMITIRVSPGKNGIDKKLQMYRGDGRNTQVGSETANICIKSICYDDVTLSYRVNSGLRDGKYYFKAERQNTQQAFTSNEFEIKHI